MLYACGTSVKAPCHARVLKSPWWWALHKGWQHFVLLQYEVKNTIRLSESIKPHWHISSLWEQKRRWRIGTKFTLFFVLSYLRSSTPKPWFQMMTSYISCKKRWCSAMLWVTHCPLPGSSTLTASAASWTCIMSTRWRKSSKIYFENSVKIVWKRNFVKYTRFYHFKCYNIFLCYKLCTSSCQLSGDTLVYLKSNAEEHRFEGQGFGNHCSGCQFSTRTL